MLKRILKAVYRFGTNCWVNMVVGLLLYYACGYVFFSMGYTIHFPSLALGGLGFISLNTFYFGVWKFFEKKS